MDAQLRGVKASGLPKVNNLLCLVNIQGKVVIVAPHTVDKSFTSLWYTVSSLSLMRPITVVSPARLMKLLPRLCLTVIGEQTVEPQDEAATRMISGWGLIS